jgi:hypothetical protein
VTLPLLKLRLNWHCEVEAQREFASMHAMLLVALGAAHLEGYRGDSAC